MTTSWKSLCNAVKNYRTSDVHNENNENKEADEIHSRNDSKSKIQNEDNENYQVSDIDSEHNSKSKNLDDCTTYDRDDLIVYNTDEFNNTKYKNNQQNKFDDFNSDETSSFVSFNSKSSISTLNSKSSNLKYEASLSSESRKTETKGKNSAVTKITELYNTRKVETEVCNIETKLDQVNLSETCKNNRINSQDDQNSVSSYLNKKGTRSRKSSEASSSSGSRNSEKSRINLDITPEKIENYEKKTKKVLEENAVLAEKLRAEIGEDAMSDIGDARVDPNYKPKNWTLTLSGIMVPKGHKQYPNTNCYICDEEGHEFMNCRVELTGNKVFCIICGQKDRKYYLCDHKPRRMRYSDDDPNAHGDSSRIRKNNDGFNRRNDDNEHYNRNRNYRPRNDYTNRKRFDNYQQNSNMNNKKEGNFRYNNSSNNIDRNDPIDFNSLLPRNSPQKNENVPNEYRSSNSRQSGELRDNGNKQNSEDSDSEFLDSSFEDQKVKNIACDNVARDYYIKDLDDFIDENKAEDAASYIVFLEKCLKSGVEITGIQVKTGTSDKPILLPFN